MADSRYIIVDEIPDDVITPYDSNRYTIVDEIPDNAYVPDNDPLVQQYGGIQATPVSWWDTITDNAIAGLENVALPITKISDWGVKKIASYYTPEILSPFIDEYIDDNSLTRKLLNDIDETSLNNEIVGGAKGTVGNIIQGVSSVAPMIGASIATGGGALIPAAVQGLSSTASNYVSNTENGAEAPVQGALISGLSEFATSLPFTRILRGAGKFIPNLIEAGVTNAADAGLQTLAQSIAYGDQYNPDGTEYLNNIKKGGLSGLGMGAFLGGTGKAGRAINRRINGNAKKLADIEANMRNLSEDASSQGYVSDKEILNEMYLKSQGFDPVTGESGNFGPDAYKYRSNTLEVDPIVNKNGEVVGVETNSLASDFDNNTGELIPVWEKKQHYFADMNKPSSMGTPTEIETASGTLGNFDYIPEQILDTPQTPSKPNLELVVDNQINPEKLSYLASNQDDFIDPFTVARYQKQYGVDRNTAIQIIQRENAEAQVKPVKDTYPQEKPKPELKLIADNTVDDLTLQRIKNQYGVNDAEAVKIALQEKQATNQLTLPEKQLSEADIQAQENWRNRNINKILGRPEAPEVVITQETTTPKDTNVKIPKDKTFKNVEEFKQTQAELAQKPAIDAVTTETTPVAKMVKPEDLMTEKSPVSRVSADEMTVKPDLMQFKNMDEEGKASGTNKENRLTGSKWDDQAGGVLLLWEPINKADYGLTGNQKYIVANGHHRFELGNRLGVKDYNVQIVKEADGWTAEDARNKAAFNNILDGKGSAEDQVVFLRNYAERQGRASAEEIANKLGLQKGDAYPIAIYSSPRLYSLYKNGKITNPKAVASIARGAPNDEAIQMVGYSKLQEGYSPVSVENFEKNYKQLVQDNPNVESLFGDDQLDMFANDSKEKALQNMMMDASQYVEKQLKELRDARKAVKPAANAVDLARKGGVNVKNQAKSQAYVDKLENQIKDLENWASNPELRKSILDTVIANKSGGTAKEAPITTPKEIKAETNKQVEDTFKAQEAVEKQVTQEATKKDEGTLKRTEQSVKAFIQKDKRLTTDLNKLKNEAVRLEKQLQQSNLNIAKKQSIKDALEANKKSQIELTHEIQNNKTWIEKFKSVAKNVKDRLGDEGGYVKLDAFVGDPSKALEKTREAVHSLFNMASDKFGNQDLPNATDNSKPKTPSASDSFFNGSLRAVKDTVDSLVDKDYKGTYNFLSPFIGWIRKNFTMPKTLADKFPTFKPTYEAGQNQIAKLSSNATEFMNELSDFSVLPKADKDIVLSTMTMNRLNFLKEGKLFRETYDNLMKIGLTPEQAQGVISVRNALNRAIDKIEEAKIADIDPNVTEATRQAKIAEIKKEVEAMRYTNYFPLSRQGKYFLAAENVNGEPYYEMFNEKSKLIKKQKELDKQGIDSIYGFADEGSMDHMIEAQGIAGFDTDYNKSLGEYLGSIARWNSKSLGAVEFREAFKQFKDNEGRLKEYAEKYRRDLNTANPQIVNQIRNVIVMKALSNPMTAAVNLTQPFITTYPELVKYQGTAKAIKTFNKSALMQAEYLTNKKNFNTKYKELGQAIEEAQAKGILSGNAQSEIHEMSRGQKNFATSALENTADLLLKPFAFSEQVSRGHAFIAGWNLAENIGITNYNEKFNYARNFSDTTQFNTNKANRPQLSRGAWALPATFKLFEGNLLRTIRNNFRGDKQAKIAGLQQLGIMLALGGARAIPFASTLFGVLASMGVDAEGDAKKIAKKLTGETMLGDFITEGIPTTLGFNIKGNLMSSNIFPESIGDPKNWETAIGKAIIGTPIQLLEDTFNAGKFLGEGNYSKAASKVLPRMIANVVDAGRWYTQGRVDDARGRVILENPSMGEIAGKAFGMTPTRVNDYYSKQNALYKIKDKSVSQSLEDKIGQLIAYKDPSVKQLIEEAENNGIEISDSKVKAAYEKYGMPTYSRIKSMSAEGKAKALEELYYRDEGELLKILQYKPEWIDKYLPVTQDLYNFVVKNGLIEE